MTTNPNSHLIQARANALTQDLALNLDWSRVAHGGELGQDPVNRKQLQMILGKLLSVPASEQNRLLNQIIAVLSLEDDRTESASTFLSRLGSQSSPHPIAG